MRLIEIPAGEFWMGSDPPEGQENEWPRRRVALGACRIGELPVTNADFEPFLREGYARREFWSADGWAWREAAGIERPRFHGDPAWQHYLSPAQPIVGVSWFEADAFARSLGLRLPSEAEWERAARGDEGQRYPWGDDFRAELAAHRGGLRHTLPAGALAGNVSPHGVRDCAGNVYQWCSDLFSAEPRLRSARGGSWNAHPPQLRCAARNAWPETARYSNLGFRVACGPGADGAASPA